MAEPIEIVCSDCGSKFIFSVEEQQFFKEKGFENPKRCSRCRIRRRELNYGRDSSERSKESEDQYYRVTCSICGAATQVPFEPAPNRPIYCRDCFQKKAHRTNAR